MIRNVVIAASPTHFSGCARFKISGDIVDSCGNIVPANRHDIVLNTTQDLVNKSTL